MSKLGRRRLGLLRLPGTKGLSRMGMSKLIVLATFPLSDGLRSPDYFSDDPSPLSTIPFSDRIGMVT